MMLVMIELSSRVSVSLSVWSPSSTTTALARYVEVSKESL
jgi:hypothetical protein